MIRTCRPEECVNAGQELEIYNTTSSLVVTVTVRLLLSWFVLFVVSASSALAVSLIRVPLPRGATVVADWTSISKVPPRSWPMACYNVVQAYRDSTNKHLCITNLYAQLDVLDC